MSLGSCHAWLRNGLAAIIVAAASPAMASASLDLCNDVLKQDVLNRTSGSSQASASARDTFLEMFFSNDVDTAYAEYKTARAEQRSSSTSVSAEGHYGIIGGTFDLSVEHGSAMSKEDFSKQFNERKATRQSQSSHSSGSESSLISTYQSAIRDPNTIEAWRACMLSRTSDPSILAYGYRDASGNPYLTVMWVPGRALASIAPQVDVRFVTPDPDVVVEGADHPVTIASGTGTGFAVRFRRPDSPARYRGFAVLVNAVAHEGARRLMDFHEEAAVPSTSGEAPCDLLIQPGRDYEYLYMLAATYRPDLEEQFFPLFNLHVVKNGTGAPNEHIYEGSVGASPALLDKALHPSPGGVRLSETTIAKMMRAANVWLKTDGAKLQLWVENRDNTPGEAHCTVNRADGTIVDKHNFPWVFKIRSTH